MDLKIKVRHAIDTTDDAISGGNLNYWEETLGVTFPTSAPCPCCGQKHSKDDFVGAHVIDMFNTLYITPTCRFCNTIYKNNKALSKWFSVFELNLIPVK